ncbi:MAG TPA: phosphoglycerate kinase [Methanomassiliicoccales archaeon]|nr:phosphoglycerate kinase [Methanomassiliicoccales archaeon]
MAEYHTLDDFDFRNKSVLLRVDINCPLDQKTLEIEDDNRIRQALPTLQELLSKGAKVAILAHQGRPGDWDFVPLDRHAKALSSLLGQEVRYIDDIHGPVAAEAIRSLGPGEAILLKNVRELPYEQDKKTMEEHAKMELVTALAPLFDYYVNDAFGASHRSQCSLVGFQMVLPSAAGRLIEKELKALKTVFDNPRRPAVFFLGGAKFADSVKVVERLIGKKIADWVVLTGVTGNAFLMARGVKLGGPSEKFLEKEMKPEDLAAARKLLFEKGLKILLPVDVAVEVECRRRELLVGDLPVEFQILDIGQLSVEKFDHMIARAGTVFMSGPAGMCEKEAFALGTRALMEATARSKAFSLIGGGHTAACAEKFGVADKLSYISTGGGALETYILGKPLPVVEALKAAYNRTCPPKQ